MLVRRLGLALLLPACGVEVSVDFTATVTEVSEGSPFGLTPDDAGTEETLATTATGSFGWVSDTPDINPDEDVGVYQHAGDAPFAVTFKDQELEGEGNATVTISNLDPDQIGFADGLAGDKPEEFMRLNGDETDDVGVTMRLQHVSGVFEDDYLPESFPGEPAEWSGELILTYRSGSVTMQIDSVE